MGELVAYKVTPLVGTRRWGRVDDEDTQLFAWVRYGYQHGMGVGYYVVTNDWDTTHRAVDSEAQGKQMIEAMWALED
jgi:hypothetical protein